MFVVGIIGILVLILLAASIFTISYYTRFQTMASLSKITNYEDYNLYAMDVKFDYNIDNIISYGINDDETMLNAIIKETLPGLPVHIKVPGFGCSAFCISDINGKVLMGRNYDFKNNTSAMLVYCTPKNGYKSVAFAALDNVSANVPDDSISKRLASLISPFICLDGMNEKGVSIAVLTLDSEPTHQQSGKPVISTTLAIRLVLDRADTTKDAVELLEKYDMCASMGRDYHFYITDASGDGRIIEYDCHSKTRKLIDTPVRTATNFFEIYKEKVLPNQKNGIYGHGRERYEKIEAILTKYESNYTKDIAWEALRSAAQDPNPLDVTSNTQWSIVYNDTDRTAEIVIRRDWKNVTEYVLDINSSKLL